MTENGSCCRCVCVKKEDFGLNWKDPYDFARSQWPIPGWSYQVYRVLFMVYIVVWLTLNTAWQIEGIGGLYFIYLTNWSFIVLGVYAIVAAFSSVFFYCRGEKKRRSTAGISRAEDDIVNTTFVTVAENDIQKDTSVESTSTKASDFNHNHNTQPANEEPISTPWYFQFTWILFNINIAIAPLVSIVYWGLLHDYGNDDGPRDPLGDGINVNVHGMNSVLILLDLFVSAYPLRITHIIYGLIYSLAYVVFSLIFWGAGGVDPSGNKYIYPVLNWEDIPGLTCAYMLGFTAVLFVAQCLMYCLYRLRLYLAGKCCNTKRNEDEQSKVLPLDTIVV